MNIRLFLLGLWIGTAALHAAEHLGKELGKREIMRPAEAQEFIKHTIKTLTTEAPAKIDEHAQEITQLKIVSTPEYFKDFGDDYFNELHQNLTQIVNKVRTEILPKSLNKELKEIKQAFDAEKVRREKEAEKTRVQIGEKPAPVEKEPKKEPEQKEPASPALVAFILSELAQAKTSEEIAKLAASLTFIDVKNVIDKLEPGEVIKLHEDLSKAIENIKTKTESEELLAFADDLETVKLSIEVKELLKKFEPKVTEEPVVLEEVYKPFSQRAQEALAATQKGLVDTFKRIGELATRLWNEYFDPLFYTLFVETREKGAINQRVLNELNTTVQHAYDSFFAPIDRYIEVVKEKNYTAGVLALEWHYSNLEESAATLYAADAQLSKAKLKLGHWLYGALEDPAKNLTKENCQKIFSEILNIAEPLNIQDLLRLLPPDKSNMLFLSRNELKNIEEAPGLSVPTKTLAFILRQPSLRIVFLNYLAAAGYFEAAGLVQERNRFGLKKEGTFGLDLTHGKKITDLYTTYPEPTVSQQLDRFLRIIEGLGKKVRDVLGNTVFKIRQAEKKGRVLEKNLGAALFDLAKDKPAIGAVLPGLITNVQELYDRIEKQYKDLVSIYFPQEPTGKFKRIYSGNKQLLEKLFQETKEMLSKITNLKQRVDTLIKTTWLAPAALLLQKAFEIEKGGTVTLLDPTRMRGLVSMQETKELGIQDLDMPIQISDGMKKDLQVLEKPIVLENKQLTMQEVKKKVFQLEAQLLEAKVTIEILQKAIEAEQKKMKSI